MKKTNFDRYLEDQMQDPRFAARFERAGGDFDPFIGERLLLRWTHRARRRRTARDGGRARRAPLRCSTLAAGSPEQCKE